MDPVDAAALGIARPLLPDGRRCAGLERPSPCWSGVPNGAPRRGYKCYGPALGRELALVPKIKKTFAERL